MTERDDLAGLRERVSALTERESNLLTEAFAISRKGGDRSQVDSLFAAVQSIQIERCAVKKRIGQLLGTRRLHLAAEVWQPGSYDYTPPEGGAPVRVAVSSQPLGLYVAMPEGRSVRIASLKGTFDGPFSVDAGAAQKSQKSRR